MGYVRHHAIIVTSKDKEQLHELRSQANKIFSGNLVSDIIPGILNGQLSFVVVPDGSHEGWPESEQYDKARTNLINLIENMKYDDGSNSISYAELQFGDENGYDHLLRHNKA